MFGCDGVGGRVVYSVMDHLLNERGLFFGGLRRCRIMILVYMLSLKARIIVPKVARRMRAPDDLCKVGKEHLEGIWRFGNALDRLYFFYFGCNVEAPDAGWVAIEGDARDGCR